MITTIGLVTTTSVTIYSYRFFSCDENLYDLLLARKSQTCAKAKARKLKIHKGNY